MSNIKFWTRGEPFIWATGLALSTIVLMTGVLLSVVLINGITVFWPADVARVTLADGSMVYGEIIQREEGEEEAPAGKIQLKIGNRDLYGLDFRWLDEKEIKQIDYPEDLFVLERLEYGNFYGTLGRITIGTKDGAGQADRAAFEAALTSIEPKQARIEELDEQIRLLNQDLDKLQHKLKKLTRRGADEEKLAPLRTLESKLQSEFDLTVSALGQLRSEAAGHTAAFLDGGGRSKEIELLNIVRYYQPNRMHFFSKTWYYLEKLVELFFAEPRESNTEGGLFPAIFGTIMLIFLMSILSFPLGVVAGIYLREYAREGVLVRLVRIAVNNLAGIPSIVYGIFGLGFFVYGIGSQIDQLFFADTLPAPTFGTGGILWASMTLGLLTVPVVIVATEEALGSIPPVVREGSMALAATKFQTLVKLLLPIASPGILTGFILAMARAAGEVAPLMITGVVKLAPALPIDSVFPYIHLDRKFMHLGFHIYDIGFQSPNVEAAKPMVYVTTLLLIGIVLLMTSTAIYLRNKMRKRYAVIDV